MILQVKALVAPDTPEVTFVKYICFKVYKKTLLQRLRSTKLELGRGTGVRFQVGVCRFDPALLYLPDGSTAKSSDYSDLATFRS
jgi:hypothetical protein